MRDHAAARWADEEGDDVGMEPEPVRREKPYWDTEIDLICEVDRKHHTRIMQKPELQIQRYRLGI
jgi:hypothetical protein